MILPGWLDSACLGLCLWSLASLHIPPHQQWQSQPRPSAARMGSFGQASSPLSGLQNSDGHGFSCNAAVATAGRRTLPGSRWPQPFNLRRTALRVDDSRCGSPPGDRTTLAATGGETARWSSGWDPHGSWGCCRAKQAVQRLFQEMGAILTIRCRYPGGPG